jgi:hypothetical protein
MFKRNQMFIPVEDIRVAFTCDNCEAVVVAVDVKQGIQNPSVLRSQFQS